MKEKITPYQRYLPSAFDSSLTVIEKINKLIELYKLLVVDFEQFDKDISKKENSVNITVNRKLSSDGNFTGNINDIPSVDLIYQIFSNRDVLNTLVWQFADGYTGQVIDCGFFEETLIKRNYDGGVFNKHNASDDCGDLCYILI